MSSICLISQILWRTKKPLQPKLNRKNWTLIWRIESDASTGADEPATVADSEDIDELDLSDLEDFMETEEAPAAQAAADDSAQDLDMDLDFQMDDGAPTIETAADSQGDDELDFSDLENMLESDETPSVEATDSTEAEELDLQFDLDEPSNAELMPKLLRSSICNSILTNRLTLKLIPKLPQIPEQKPRMTIFWILNNCWRKVKIARRR